MHCAVEHLPNELKGIVSAHLSVNQLTADGDIIRFTHTYALLEYDTLPAICMTFVQLYFFLCWITYSTI